MNRPKICISTLACIAILSNTCGHAQTDPENPTALEDPVPDEIQLGDIEVNLVEFVRAPESEDDSAPFGTNDAYARIQYLKSPPDESGRLFFNDTRGILYVTDEEGSEPTVYLDLRDMEVDFYPDVFPHESGFMSFAFHHEFAVEDSPGYGKFYTAFTADPESGTADFIEETNSAQESVIYEWTAVDPTALEFFGSRREVLRVGQFRPNHNIGNIDFNPFSLVETDENDDSDGGDGATITEDDGTGDDEATETRHEDWGMLFISFGDGGGSHDPRDHGQNVGTPLGAILRIDPLIDDLETEESYQIPADNPEIEGAIPELWAFGLRHPQHFSWDTDGRMFILDIGQDQVEEVNLGSVGANYGWRQRKGTFATAHGIETEDGLGGVYEVDLEAEENDFVYPVAQYDHDEGFAIGSGFVYRGESVPELVGKYVFTELVRGRVLYIETEPEPTTDGDEESDPDETDDVDDVLIPGEPTTIYELQLLFNGEEGTMSDVAGMSNTYLQHSPHLRRVDLRVSVDRHGEMYLLSKGDGWIRKIEQVPEEEPEPPQ
ncbi:MAG: PQQ-dependent sugar dehydrogenase [Gammaproteobacteria bacterium]|nr:PQQ-dependent sugar dehydrogenase [Gammaproteobacteria bacterium]MYD80206.1 PQQ-dependent sugar dehydrogenase [Gammaproteobacteria bacterium]